MPDYICNECGYEVCINGNDEHEPCPECGEMMDIVWEPEEADDA